MFPNLSFIFLFATVVLTVTAINLDETKTFIVRVQNNLQPSEFSSIEQWYSSILYSIEPEKAQTDFHLSKTHRNLIHVYKTAFHGFSALLTEKQAHVLKKRREILELFTDKVHTIDTTRTPLFLGLRPRKSSVGNPTVISKDIWSLSNYGSNVVIGMMDTGIWPERRSFRDEGLDPVPKRWRGECTEGEKFSKSICNRKIIGARYFVDGYLALTNRTGVLKSPRDTNGHGTHTASIAAGSRVVNASFLDRYASGEAVGIAPKARLAIYKVCWKQYCMSSDIVAAFDRAIEDKVDIISISIGDYANEFYLDPIAVAAFRAAENGILVMGSAGNEGPHARSVNFAAPWIISVGAGTIDRQFPADLVLEDGRVITGSSLFQGIPLPEKTFLPLVFAGNASMGGVYEGRWCGNGTLDPNLVKGKIVFCEAFHEAVVCGATVLKAGGAGVVVSTEGQGLTAPPLLIPGLSISQSDSIRLREYLESSNPRATIIVRGTEVGTKPAPKVASFSSRGPSLVSNYLLKPDVIAPGVDILAAWPEGVPLTRAPGDTRSVEFNVLSGTSMSCPHVSGLAALLKGAHPDWSPAMIRSALMTTAYTHDRDGKPIVDAKNNTAATVWDMGVGHVDAQRAVDPGLVYDLTIDDYKKFLCASNYTDIHVGLITHEPIVCSSIESKPWDLNLPAIVLTFNQTNFYTLQVSATRTVTNVYDGASNYTITIDNPDDISLTVDPQKLEFKSKGEKHSYTVKMVAKKSTPSNYRMKMELGKLVWSDGTHIVTSPVVLMFLP